LSVSFSLRFTVAIFNGLISRLLDKLYLCLLDGIDPFDGQAEIAFSSSFRELFAQDVNDSSELRFVPTTVDAAAAGCG
jgi:hypothetical protein